MKIAQLPQRQRRQNIILAILIIGLPILLFAAYKVVQIVSRASGDTDPKNVVISNVTTTMATISWTTDTKTYGTLIPLENDKEKSEVRDTRGSDRRYTHYVELENLEPNTQYNFKIKSNNTKYSSSEGKNLTFTTAPISADLPSVNPASGELNMAINDDVLIYIFLSDRSTFPVSATLGNSKTWITDLSALLKISDKSRVSVDQDTGITILATGGNMGGAELLGTYSSLFNSNGTLKETNQLILNKDLDIYSKIPDAAKLAVSVPVTEPSKEPEQPVIPPVKPTPSRPITPTQPVEKEDIPDEEFTNREYRIVHQLQWQELAEVSSKVSTNVGPDSVRVTNLTDVGFTVLWVSEKKEYGQVKYGISPEDLRSTAYDQRDGISTKGTYYVHSVKLERLQPTTKYYYEIISGEDVYNNNEKRYSITTLSTVESAPPFVSISGSLTNMPNHGEAVVIGSIKDVDEIGSLGSSYEVSTLVDEKGSWAMPIGDLRSADSNSYFEYTSGDKLIIEPFTTFKTSKREENMEGIDSRDIKFALDTANPGKSVIVVSQLSSYGITNDPKAIITSEAHKTPSTGVLDNFVGMILISSALLISGVLVFILSKKKGKENDKMSKSL